MNHCTLLSAAERAAHRNLAANSSSLGQGIEPPHVGEWVFGRDGYLTALDPTGQWMTACSLPRRTAEELLRKLDVCGQVACFLSPTHAAQIRVALDRMAPEQAVIVLLSQSSGLQFILACDDFSDEIRTHRLWFADGIAELRARLESNTGLPVPSQFIRLPGADERLIPEAQAVFSGVTASRANTMRKLRDCWNAPHFDRICLIAPSRFRLWNDSGHAIRKLLDAECAHVDLDDPANASPLAIVEAMSDCSAAITIDTGRADSPGVLPDELPWLTRLTSHRVPAFAGAAKRDQLIVVNSSLREIAIAEGWPADRLHIAATPAPRDFDSRPPRSLAIIENTLPLDAPADLMEFSSHMVLWESIAQTLLSDPFKMTVDAQDFLRRAAQKLEIAPQTLNAGRFIRELILPAYAQGVARAIIHSGLPIKLFGRGWDRIREFAKFAAGDISSRSELNQVLAQPIALVHVWAWQGSHAVYATGKPVVRAVGNSLSNFTRAARQIFENPSVFGPKADEAPLSLDLIKKVIHHARSDS